MEILQILFVYKMQNDLYMYAALEVKMYHMMDIDLDRVRKYKQWSMHAPKIYCIILQTWSKYEYINQTEYNYHVTIYCHIYYD